MVQGIVTDINPQRGMMAVEVQPRTFTIIGLMDTTHQPEIGDEFRWKEGAYGPAECLNVTQHVLVDVVFENHDVTPQQLNQQLLRG